MNKKKTAIRQTERGREGWNEIIRKRKRREGEREKEMEACEENDTPI